MEHDYPPPYGGRASSIPDFAFAFNDSKFSDRILRIEIMASPSAAFKPQDAASTIADWARNRKRMKKDPVVGICESQGEQVIVGSHQEAEEAGPFDAIDDDPVAMVEESSPPSAMLSSSPDDDNLPHDWATEPEVVLRVRTLHISSAILASKSPFFYKLFSNGMKESEQRDVTLHISASEEDALMDLLQFMYTGVLNASSVVPLLDVLMAAEKYQVAACMHYCSMLLRKLPMSIDSALLYLELPSSVLLAEAMQPLTDAAKSYLVSQYKDVMSYQEDLLNLPLCGIEAVLSSDDLQVTSEDVIYDLVIKWAKANYPKPEERKEILSSRLVRLIRFPMMANRKLKKVLASPELDHDVATKFVLEALFYKTEAPYRQRALAGEETLYRKYRERAYKYRPVKVQEFDKPFQQCIAYLDLKKEECIALCPQGKVYSQAFQLGGQGFFLSAHCNQDQQNSFQCFGLFLGMQDKGSVSFSVDYEFSSRMKPSKDFIVKYRGTYKFTGGKAVGYRNLFGIEWSSFVGDDSPYFIDDVLYLRAELTIKPDSG